MVVICPLLNALLVATVFLLPIAIGLFIRLNRARYVNPRPQMDSSTEQSDWLCKRCGARCPATLDTCWNCGASIDGRPDATFEPVRDLGESRANEPLWSPPQWSLRDMFWWTSLSALWVAALIYLPAGLVLVAVLLWIALTPFSRQIVKRLRKLAQRAGLRGPKRDD